MFHWIYRGDFEYGSRSVSKFFVSPPTKSKIKRRTEPAAVPSETLTFHTSSGFSCRFYGADTISSQKIAVVKIVFRVLTRT